MSGEPSNVQTTLKAVTDKTVTSPHFSNGRLSSGRQEQQQTYWPLLVLTSCVAAKFQSLFQISYAVFTSSHYWINVSESIFNHLFVFIHLLFWVNFAL